MTRRIRLAGVALVTFVVAACGSGGPTGTSTPPAPTATSTPFVDN